MRPTMTLLAAVATATSFLILGCTGFYSGDGEEEEVRTQRRTVAYARWDVNGDGALSRNEFTSWWAERGPFVDWDGDDDGEISEAELSIGLYDAWDENDNGDLSENEWESGVTLLGEEADRGGWSDWDADGDGELDAGEFREGLDRHGLYDAVDDDDDGIVDEEELRSWFFEALDTDGDGEIDAMEWDGFEI